MSASLNGPWVVCPRCAGPVPLVAFAAADDERGLSTATCRSCAERVYLLDPPGQQPEPPRWAGDAGQGGGAV